MWTQIADGKGSDFEAAKSYEVSGMNEGQRGRLVINFLIDLPSTSFNGMRDSLRNGGVEDLEMASSGRQLIITWRKGFAWVPVIILAVLALAILIISWRLLKEVADVVSQALEKLGSPGAILVVLLVGAVMLLPYFLKKKA